MKMRRQITSFDIIFDIVIQYYIRYRRKESRPGEGQVDKIADLGFWIFFSSYVCKLRGKAIFFT